LAGCADLDGQGAESEDAHEGSAESNLTSSEKEAICNAIPTPRPWTADESTKLLDGVVRRVVQAKRQNDALIRERGVGGYAGAGTNFWKAIDRGDKNAAAAILRPKLKPGYDALRIAGEIKGTSCIGYLYTVLRDVYAELDRSSEWAAIEKCGRAWDSDGLHVQQALIKNGWPAPSVGFVSDERKLPGTESEVTLHREFLRAAARGSYYGTPVSTTLMMKNFLPTPGSSTRVDDAYFLRVGASKTLAFGTFRGAFHTPFIVPGASIPADILTTDAARAAHSRGEPFVLESHRLREPWDDTNLEIRPLTAVIAETFGQSVTYATGTMLFAPGGEALLQ
jgi:hypothetical protein